MRMLITVLKHGGQDGISVLKTFFPGPGNLVQSMFFPPDPHASERISSQLSLSLNPGFIRL